MEGNCPASGPNQLLHNTNASDLRIKIAGAEEMRLNAEGDLLMQIENAQLVLHKPVLYEEISGRELAHKGAAPASPAQRCPIEGAYQFESDRSIGFRIARRHPHAALVIDVRWRWVIAGAAGGGMVCCGVCRVTR